MRDVDDGAALRPHTPEDAGRAINVGVGPGRGGLGQKRERGGGRERGGDLEEWARTDGQGANWATETPVGKAERRQGLLCAQAELGPPVQKRNLGAPKPNIVEDRQMRREAELLR